MQEATEASAAPPGDPDASGAPGAPDTPAAGRGRRLWRLLRELLIFAAIFLAFRAYQQRDLPSGPAPELSGVALDGSPLSLEAYRGKPVLVHFWASWCGVCKVEAPNIQSVSEDMPVITVASQSGTAADVRAFMAERGLDWVTVGDPDNRLARRFGVRAFPTSFVLDGDGRIRHAEVGYTSALGLRARMWLAAL